MTFLQKNISISILITNCLIAQSQEGIWVNEYTINTENNKKSNELSNRLMFKIEKDSIFTFDSGKEEWKGTIEMGFSYLKKENILSIPKIGIELEYINESQLIFKNQNKVLHFKRIKPKKNNFDKFRNLISNNIFVSELTNQKKDTISFQINRNFPKYSFNNVGVYLMEFDNSNSLLFANFKGENIYEIDCFNKKGFSIIENSKNGPKKIDFKVVEIENLDKYVINEKKLMLENK
jgi:hypothetical protein